MESSLADAVKHAVVEGKRAAEELRETIDAVVVKLHSSIEILKPWADWKTPTGGRSTPSAVAERLSAEVDQRQRAIRSLFERQERALATFNIALFGRTGAGKSSLIEALSHGDGQSVSQGESDWTVEVHAVEWQGCRLIDTPGINGWGRTQSRTELETHARRAVEVADVVLLCFDTQSQQEAEFRKVAEWVQSYGKPVVAVLNCRNGRWRMPRLVHLASARRNMSKAVREHDGNIRDELARLGLSSVPVVAVSAKRALFARAKLPFVGPDAATLAKHRADHGEERLLEWSNLRALEELIAESIRRDAATIRLGMLRAQVRGVIEDLDREMEATAADARAARGVLETSIESILNVLGYPTAGSGAREIFADPRCEDDLLSELERLRKSQFDSPVTGEFETHYRQLLTTKLGALRATSQRNAEETVIDAFERRVELDARTFNAAVFKETQIEAAGAEIVEQAADFLQRRLNLVSRDAGVDMRCLVEGKVSVDGAAGKRMRGAALAAKAGGILSGVASTIATIAVTQGWNPAGWIGVAVAGVTGVLSGILKWLGGKAQKTAEEKRLAARRNAIASARAQVDAVYDRFTEDAARQVADIGRATLGKALAGPLREGIAVRLTERQCASARRRFAALLSKLAVHDTQKVFAEAARGLEKKAHGKAAAPGPRLWLGEGWIEDPDGLKADEGDDAPVRTRAYDPGRLAAFFESIRSMLQQVGEKPGPGDGGRWLERATRELGDQPLAAGPLAELGELLADGRPRIHLVGDYNAGKSSFIKRLLVDGGKPVPPELTVRADPTTSRVRSYPWDGVLLVDSPGFHGSRAEHDQEAERGFPDASHLVCLFQPNLLASSIDALEPALKGDLEAGIVSKLSRALFFINRSDELGVDPHDDPEEYARMSARKRREISEALARRGIRVDEARVCCVASDPYGLVGDRRDVSSAQYDEFRSWDGFSEVAQAFRDVRREATRTGVDVSVLEGGMARLGRLRRAALDAARALEAEREVLQRIEGILKEGFSEAAGILADIEAELDRIVQDHALGLMSDALAAVDEEELAAQAKLLAEWWKDPAFKAAVDRWGAQSEKKIKAWLEKLQEVVARRLGSAEFRRAFPDIAAHFDAAGLAEEKNSTARFVGWLEKGAKVGGNRNVIYSLGKAIGVKFRPWGAVKMAGRVAKVGAALGAIGVGLDVWDWVQSSKREKNREGARKKARKFVQESSREMHDKLLSGEHGPGAHLGSLRKELSSELDRVAAELERLRGEIGTRERWARTNEVLMREAARFLGMAWGDER